MNFSFRKPSYQRPVKPDLRQEISVAIEYDPAAEDAPSIAASGKAEASKQIRRIAQRYGVPLVRNDALAKHLSEIEVEHEITPDLYESVAKVLYDIEE